MWSLPNGEGGLQTALERAECAARVARTDDGTESRRRSQECIPYVNEESEIGETAATAPLDAALDAARAAPQLPTALGLQLRTGSALLDEESSQALELASSAITDLAQPFLRDFSSLRGAVLATASSIEDARTLHRSMSVVSDAVAVLVSAIDVVNPGGKIAAPDWLRDLHFSLLDAIIGEESLCENRVYSWYCCPSNP